MGTNVTSQLSKKNKYYISKHRFLELKHFCLQYHEWKDELRSLEETNGLKSDIFDRIYDKNKITDPTARIAMRKKELDEKITLIEQTAKDADEQLDYYILKAVTNGLSFSYLSTIMQIPCGKDMFYDRYRRFFFLLSRYSQI